MTPEAHSDSAPGASAPDAIDAWLQAAEAAMARAEPAQALASARQAWEALAADDAPRRRRAGPTLVGALYRTGALQQAIDVALQVLPLLREQPVNSERVDLLLTASLCASDVSRLDLALALAQEAHLAARALGEPARLSLSVNVLGCFFERTGDPWQAERLLLEALALARQQPATPPLASALNNLSAALIGKFHMLRDAVPIAEAREALRAALPFATEAVALARAGPQVFHQVFTLGNLGEILVLLGDDVDAARQALDEAMVLAERHGFVANSLRLACSLAELDLLLGRPDAACQRLNAALPRVTESDQGTTLMRLHHALWRCAQAQPGHGEAALAHLQHYLRLERKRTVTQLRAQSELFVTRMEVELAREEARRHDARARALEDDVHRDPLTGLGNRREVERRWPALLDAARSQGGVLSLAMIDIDHFKAVNDRFGHAVGDRVLVALASLLRANTRSHDLIARVGGEEFMLVLPEAGAERAADVCERLRAQVADHDWQAIAAGLKVTLSIGVASTPPCAPDELSLRADAALYRAKALGRNAVVRP